VNFAETIFTNTKHTTVARVDIGEGDGGIPLGPSFSPHGKLRKVFAWFYYEAYEPLWIHN